MKLILFSKQKLDIEMGNIMLGDAMEVLFHDIGPPFFNWSTFLSK